eukprot:5802760-Amphidinium_carterae.1
MFLAQSTHQHTLWSFGALHGAPPLVLTLLGGTRFREEHYGQLAFIDEAMSLEQNTSASVLSEANRVRSEVHAAYDRTGFVCKIEKSKRDEEEPELWAQYGGLSFHLPSGRLYWKAQ